MKTPYVIGRKWDFPGNALSWVTDMAERDKFHCEIDFESRKNVPSLRVTTASR